MYFLLAFAISIYTQYNQAVEKDKHLAYHISALAAIYLLLGGFDQMVGSREGLENNFATVNGVPLFIRNGTISLPDKKPDPARLGPSNMSGETQHITQNDPQYRDIMLGDYAQYDDSQEDRIVFGVTADEQKQHDKIVGLYKQYAYIVPQIFAGKFNFSLTGLFRTMMEICNRNVSTDELIQLIKTDILTKNDPDINLWANKLNINNKLVVFLQDVAKPVISSRIYAMLNRDIKKTDLTLQPDDSLYQLILTTNKVTNFQKVNSMYFNQSLYDPTKLPSQKFQSAQMKGQMVNPPAQMGAQQVNVQQPANQMQLKEKFYVGNGSIGMLEGFDGDLQPYDQEDVEEDQEYQINNIFGGNQQQKNQQQKNQQIQQKQQNFYDQQQYFLDQLKDMAILETKRVGWRPERRFQNNSFTPNNDSVGLYTSNY